MKKFLLLLMAIAITGVVANAANYEINVGGVEVTTSNYSNVTGGDISGGTVSYDPNSKVLTLNNVTIYRYDSSSKYAVHNRDCENLTIKFVGTCRLYSEKGPALMLAKNTKLNFYSGTSTIKSQTNNAVVIKSSVRAYVLGSGSAEFETIGGSAECIKGEKIEAAGSSSVLEFQNARVSIKSYAGYAINTVAIQFWKNSGAYVGTECDVRIKANGKKKSVNNCSFGLPDYIGVALLEPYGAYYSSSGKTICNSSGSPVINDDILLSSNYVAILNSTYFPDANFRGYLQRSLFPKGYITTNDVNATTAMNVGSEYISDLTGLGYFSKLVSFGCEENNLTSLSLPSLPSSLQTLECEQNKFTTFTLTNHSALKTLNISSTPTLTTLNVYNNSALTSLNFTNCTSLATLDCHGNKLTSLSELPTSLKVLDGSNNKFTSISIISRNYTLTSVNISNNPYLTNADVSYNFVLTSLNVANCPAMTTLSCSNNKLTQLTLSGCSALTILSCGNNQLTSLSNLPSTLQKLSCGYNNFSGTFNLTNHNALTYLDLGLNYNLVTVNVSNNSLTDLLVDHCTSLTTLNCINNQLSYLSVSGCSALTDINCQYNKLTSFDNLSSCSSLKTLNCINNRLTSLDVSSLSNLTELRCNWNELGSLNVSNKTKLTSLSAGYNQLTSLNVQGCSSLNYLYLESNKLTSLTVQGCNALRTLNCCLNQINSSGANTLINSLCTIPAGSTGVLQYIYPGYSSGFYVEKNVNLTDAQVRAARNKRWIPYKFVAETGWVEIPVNTAIPGDVNGDGQVTAADITALYDVLLNNDYNQIVNGDQTGDGVITAADVTAVYTIMLSSKE